MCTACESIRQNVCVCVCAFISVWVCACRCEGVFLITDSLKLSLTNPLMNRHSLDKPASSNANSSMEEKAQDPGLLSSFPAFHHYPQPRPPPTIPSSIPATFNLLSESTKLISHLLYPLHFLLPSLFLFLFPTKERILPSHVSHYWILLFVSRYIPIFLLP